MSSLIYFVADLYPWWGIPLGFIFLELANYYRRQGDRKKLFRYLTISSFFFATAVAYFFYNGLEHLRPAMQEMERAFNNK